MLQDLAGIDFTEIDAKYKAAYADRTGKNAIAKNALAKLQAIPEVEKVDPVDVSELQNQIQHEKDRLNQLYQDNKKKNTELRTMYEATREEASAEYHKQLEKQSLLRGNKMRAEALLDDLRLLGYQGVEVAKFIEAMPTIEAIEEPRVNAPEYVEEMPDQSTLDKLTAQLSSVSEINNKAQLYDNRLKIVAEVKEANTAAENADQYVKEIEAQRKQMILDAKFPEGIEISEDGVLVEGMALDKKQISTSKLYITALKLAALNLAQVRTLHFDASPLDRDNLNQIQQWAEENDLQLLIERPSFDDQEIRYEIVDTTA
jgi:hypothetical protein